MNANAIQSGLDYAYTPYPSRNKIYYAGAVPVRVLHVYGGLDSPYYRRRVTLVECVRLLPDGEVDTTKRLLTVSPRNIVALWSEHLIEKDHAEQQRHEESERIRKADEERRNAVQAAHVARMAEEQKLITSVVEQLKVPSKAVHVTHNSVVISRWMLEEVLKESNATQNSEPITDQNATNQPTAKPSGWT